MNPLERNRTNLVQALQRLPEYEPPAAVWENLAQALPQEPLQAAIAALPTYAPPPTVWANIAAELPAPPLSVRRARRVWAWRAAAAVLLLLAVGAWWSLRPVGEAGTTVSQIQVENKLLEPLQQPEEDAFALVQTLCATQQPVCREPEFVRLKESLDELTTARQQLRDALGPYGADPHLVAELVAIERERTELLHQLITFI